MQHVASKSSVHHSQHHGIDPRGRAPAAEPKQPATPFSLLLDGPEDAPPPRPKQQDDTTKTSEPSRTGATEASRNDQTQQHLESEPSRTAATEAPRSDQTQQHPAHDPEANAAGAGSPAPEETEKSAEKSDEKTVVATSPEDDVPKTADTADETATVTIAAPTIPLPVAVVQALPTTTPAALTDNTEAGATADLAQAAAAAGLKADQPPAPKGKAAQKAPSGPSAADESQPVDAAPAADPGKTADAGKTAHAGKTADPGETAGPGETANAGKTADPGETADPGATADPVEAPKPHEAQAPPASPDQDKPEHAHVHAAAAIRSEVRSTDELANPLTTTHAPDSAPTDKPADGAQLVNVQHQAERTGNTAAPAAPAPNNLPAAVPLAGLAVEIAARAQAGRNRFEIRLDPPELGRIHVSLDVDKSGQVTSRLVVDRAETLDALRRDAADLERALQQAGLKTSDNGLQFTLRDQSFAGRDDGFTSASTARLVVPDPDLAPVEAAPAGYSRLLRAGGGVDIRV